jgi:Protein of unknown function (DUF1616)
MAFAWALAPVGFLLVFLLPGYAVTKAVFPEWRVRGPAAGLRAVEIGTLSLVLSVGLTVVVGFALLDLPGPGFAAYWTDPVLEVTLGAIAFVALIVGALRGAYRHEPPDGPTPEPSPGSENGWELVRRLDSIERTRRRLEHQLRVLGDSDRRAQEWRDEIQRLVDEAARIRRTREEEYAE